MSSWIRARPSWFWLALSGALIVLIAVASLQPTNAKGVLSPRSSAGDGGLALYLWLGKLGYQTQDLTSSFHPEDLRHSQATLLLLPGADLDVNSTHTLLSWVRRDGGRLVLITDGFNGGTLLSALGLRLVQTPDDVVRVSEPVLLDPLVSRLQGHATLALADFPPGGEAAQTAYGPVLARRSLGAGTVWIITAPALLENSGIAHAQNSALALNLVGNPGSKVVFDEYLPASTSGSSDWLTGTTWGALIWFLLAVALLYRWLAGRRLGPAIIPLAEGHRAATEYVVSIARLLRRGQKRSEILAMYQRSLQRSMRERFGDDDPQRLSLELRSHVQLLLSHTNPRTDVDLLRLTVEIVECEHEVRSGRV